MRGKSRVVHAGHRGVLGEEARDAQRARRLVTPAQTERLEPAMEQEAGVRIEGAAQMVEGVLRRLDAAGAPRDRPGDEVAVAVQVLGRAVQHQIESMLDGTEPE